MAYWLLKSEPGDWSWDEQVARGQKGEMWDGVRNYQARNFMQLMKKGDLGFFYHSGGERQIVGIVMIAKEAYPDPTSDDDKWVVVDVVAEETFKTPVTLADIKADGKLAEMILVKNSRLSVQPVTTAEWKRICAMAGIKTK
ncbi:MAG: EVE domain-containing protein [Pseudomonadota bacterium]